MVKHYNSYFYQVFSKNMWFFIKDMVSIVIDIYAHVSAALSWFIEYF